VPTDTEKRQPNWILRIMVAVSLAVHAVIFMHITGLYNSRTLSVIEVAVRDEDPRGRSIPRPRRRHETPKTSEVKKIDVSKPHVPQMKMERVETDCPDSISEEIAMPDTSGLSAGVADWQPGAVASSDYLTRGDYFDMLRMKIQSRKKYPERARQRQIEGRVVVGFTLDEAGGVTAAEVVKSSRHPSLDRAAVRAVKAAGPFPRPPAKLFEGPLRMTITIMFELM